MKQMRIIYMDGYSRDDLLRFRTYILENMKDSIESFINMKNETKFAFSNKKNEVRAGMFDFLASFQSYFLSVQFILTMFLKLTH
jgi:hypothetical protein